MKTKIGLVLFSLIFVFSNSYSQDNLKREFRAAWLSTVTNIDWPSAPGGSVESQKEQLITILDYLKDVNLNAVIFQIRPACDAMYKSEFEPWSSWLTGQQGKAPAGDFDPLAFAIEEAHARGMELHAWFNPYRVNKAAWNLQLHESNIARKNPEWVLNISGDEILDPGLPQVREYVTGIVMDVVRRYDVDAIHFDDYFYLDDITNEDAHTFQDYPKGFTDLGDWRRDNVNELLRMIHAGIQQEKPEVKFGQSPRGIWKNNVPEGVYGNSNYHTIYCDAVTWLDEQIIDYLAPQLYWRIGGAQDYSKLMPWWVSVRNERHIYPGLAYYRVSLGSSNFDETQLGRMVTLNRQEEGCQGEIYFTSHNFRDNLGGNTDTLKNSYYQNKAIIPTMDWKDMVPPSEPENLRFDRVAGLGTTGITWDEPDDGRWYALYKFNTPNFSADDLKNPENIYDVTGRNYFNIDENFPSEKFYYVVTALDRNHNESVMSNVFEFEPSTTIPVVPELVYPIAGSNDEPDTINVIWKYSTNATTYDLEISLDPSFASIDFLRKDLIDTSFVVTGLRGESEYHWRVKANNYLGSSDYSEVRTFTTAFPASPELLSPANQSVDLALEVDFEWTSRDDAIEYQFQLYDGLGADENKLIIDTSIAESKVSASGFMPSSFYAWRVRVINSLGTSLWSEIFKFKTLSILPEVPSLVSPADNKNDAGAEVTFEWESSNYARNYDIQVALDESFTNRIVNESGIFGTTYLLKDLEGETSYFWRLRSSNNSGKSEFSDIRKFSTGFPVPSVLISPTDFETEVSITPTLIWTSSAATSYLLQMSEGNAIDEDKLVLDDEISDTTFTTHSLKLQTIYSWRVKGINSIGDSEWSSVYKFKTVKDTTSDITESQLPLSYDLYQNFPNPFNPSTSISFDLPKSSMVKLNVYNAIGQHVSTLVNEEMAAGSYTYRFNTADENKKLASGLYIYVLEAAEKRFVKKMMLLK